MGHALLRLPTAHVPRVIPTAFWPENVGSFRSSRPHSPEKHTVALKTATKTMEKTCSQKHGPRRHIFTVSNSFNKKTGTATAIAVLVSFSPTTAFQSPLLPSPQTSTRDILVRFCVPSGVTISPCYSHETIFYTSVLETPNLNIMQLPTRSAHRVTPQQILLGCSDVFLTFVKKTTINWEEREKNCTRCEVPKQIQRFVDRFYKCQTYSRILRQ